MQLYSRADSWLGWGEARRDDNVIHSLGRVFYLSMHGLASTLKSIFTRDGRGNRNRRGRDPLSITGTFLSILFIAAIFLNSQGIVGQAAPSVAKVPATANAPAVSANVMSADADRNDVVTPGHYQDLFTLNDTGSPQIEMHGIDSQHNIYFTLPEAHVACTACRCWPVVLSTEVG